jgi:hypothetical protein
MNVEGRLKRVEEKLGIDSQTGPMVLIIGRRGGRKVDEAELERRIGAAIRRQPKAPFILLT